MTKNEKLLTVTDENEETRLWLKKLRLVCQSFSTTL